MLDLVEKRYTPSVAETTFRGYAVDWRIGDILHDTPFNSTHLLDVINNVLSEDDSGRRSLVLFKEFVSDSKSAASAELVTKSNLCDIIHYDQNRHRELSSEEMDALVHRWARLLGFTQMTLRHDVYDQLVENRLCVASIIHSAAADSGDYHLTRLTESVIFSSVPNARLFGIHNTINDERMYISSTQVNIEPVQYHS